MRHGLKEGIDFNRMYREDIRPALLVAGCGDLQSSYDASFHGRPNGAFTHWAFKELEKKPETPSQWLNRGDRRRRLNVSSLRTHIDSPS
jgi:hypothetical protein